MASASTRGVWLINYMTNPRSRAAALLGRIKSKKKAKSSAQNAKKARAARWTKLKD